MENIGVVAGRSTTNDTNNTNHETKDKTGIFRHFSANATKRVEKFVLVLNEMVLLLVLGPSVIEYEYRLRLSRSTESEFQR
jgi:hypothetical protein